MRADLYLFTSGRAKSREAAKKLISAGGVTLDGRTLTKPSEEIDEGIPHEAVITAAEKFVSRGGLKLEAALDSFGIDVTGFSALDIGSSTGGFTDCLLKRGAASVTAVDSGKGQLDPSLASDRRVRSIEKYNARELSPDILPGGADIVVMDVSFISQTLIIPAVPAVMKPDGYFVSLIKPQFEAGRAAVGKGGIVRDAGARLASVMRVTDSASGVGLVCTGLIVSPITGGDGNTEYLACFRKNGRALDFETLKKIVR